MPTNPYAADLADEQPSRPPEPRFPWLALCVFFATAFYIFFEVAAGGILPGFLMMFIVAVCGTALLRAAWQFIRLFSGR